LSECLDVPGLALVRSLGVAILTDDKTGRASILSGVVFSMPWWLDARRVFDDVETDISNAEADQSGLSNQTGL
jgi:hypothetical protein